MRTVLFKLYNRISRINRAEMKIYGGKHIFIMGGRSKMQNIHSIHLKCIFYSAEKNKSAYFIQAHGKRLYNAHGSGLQPRQVCLSVPVVQNFDISPVCSPIKIKMIKPDSDLMRQLNSLPFRTFREIITASINPLRNALQLKMLNCNIGTFRYEDLSFFSAKFW